MWPRVRVSGEGQGLLMWQRIRARVRIYRMSTVVNTVYITRGYAVRCVVKGTVRQSKDALMTGIIFQCSQETLMS